MAPIAKLPPQDLDAEQAVLGACLLDPGALPLVSAVIAPSDFYSERHRDIFAAMLALAQGGGAVDYLTLTSHLEARKQLDDIGGSLYVSSLVTGLPTAAHVEHYARIVLDKSRRRQGIALAGDIAAAAYNESSDFEAMRGAFLTKLVQGADTEGGAEHISLFVHQLTAQVEARAADPKDVFGIATGFGNIDRATGGLQPGETLLIPGEPGKGKTMFVTQMLVQAAQGGVPVALYEMDTRWDTVVRRQVSFLSNVGTRAMQTGRMDGQMEAYYDGAGRLSALPFYLSKRTNWTTAALRADVMQKQNKHGIRVVAVDYFDLFRDRGMSSDPYRRDAEIAGECKRLAMDLNVALVIVHTMTKEAMKDGMVRLAAASGGRGIIYAFENVAFLTDFIPRNAEEEAYPEAQKARLVSLTFSKQRESEGGTGRCQFVRRDGIPAFGELALHENGGY